MAKMKVDFKSLLLEKGEKLVIGIAGLVMISMIGFGMYLAANTESSEKNAEKLDNGARSVRTKIANQNATVEDLPAWARGKFDFAQVAINNHRTNSLYFDPIAQPENKRKNPEILKLTEMQTDLGHFKIRSYDLQESVDGKGAPRIGVVVASKTAVKGEQKKIFDALRKGLEKRKPGPPRRPGTPGFQPGMQPGMQPGAQPGGPMGMASGPMGMPGGPMGMPGMPGGEGGMPGMGFNPNDQRTEINYVDLDKLEEGNYRIAETIYPKRMIIVNAAFPYKAQLEEFRKALRLNSVEDVLRNPLLEPIFDGIIVERQVLSLDESKVIQPWAPFDFGENYRRTIYPRQVNVNADDPDLSIAMLPPSFKLVLPLPQLIGNGKYPEVKLDSITKLIAKVRESERMPVIASEAAKKFKGQADDIYNASGFSMPGVAAGMPGMPGAGEGPGNMIRPTGLMNPMGSGPMGAGPMGAVTSFAMTDVLDHALVRFADSDIRPGLSYQYRIQMKVRNPNYKQEKLVSKPTYAQEEFLFGAFAETPVTRVPYESFLYAIDPPTEKGAKQPKDGEAMIQMQSWVEQIRVAANIREPVGDWVIADFIVSKGEYLGSKQLVKLPLWSSLLDAYLIREIPQLAAKNKTPGASKEPKKGVEIDFAQKTVAIDIGGGRERRKVENRMFEEDSWSEILVITGDGKYKVLSSSGDTENAERKKRETDWTTWVRDVDRNGGSLPAANQPAGIFSRPNDK